ncbi:leukemia inhibitory factor receptor [Lampris incognitus]|uniref:leukemia inhibitory factor receptor n=1 Tax=Lampris incognitus TaxID=2546036 RepID=UPI0024B52BF7|nr:leukemia inhibitory factor receptor [Lampris incognitus]
MTAHVIDKSDPRKCAKALFTGVPRQLVRCDPPFNATFRRVSGQLEINAMWRQADRKAIRNYYVRYKTAGSPQWSKRILSVTSPLEECGKQERSWGGGALAAPEIHHQLLGFPDVELEPVQSKDVEKCIVENVNSSLVHEVQIQCVANEKCSQCPWSNGYTAPPGQSPLHCIFPSGEPVEGYHVSVAKASGEPPSVWMNTRHPEIKLVLSFSAYLLSIAAFNNVSTSPAVSRTILPPENSKYWFPQRNKSGRGYPKTKLNVTFNSNTSFTLSWKDDLFNSCSCYSVEWYSRGHETRYMSFFENKNKHKTISFKEPLEPHERYSISLHTRDTRETCNIKHINNSESTYGSTHFYFTEGSPLGAPTNISAHSVTASSMVLQWTSVPEEDVRGVLLGYIIFYNEYHHRATRTEKNVTVEPTSNSHELGGLSSGTVYVVQISAFTRAGVGARSTLSHFETSPQGHPTLGVAIATVVLLVVLICLIKTVSLLFKSVKNKFWSSIPNPGNSNAVQKIDGSSEREIQRHLNTLQLEEWDTYSLHIIDKGAESTTSELLPSNLAEAEGNSDSEQLSTDSLNVDWFQEETETASEDLFSHITAGASVDMQQKESESLPFTFPSDYTTMEMFQQATPSSTPALTTASNKVSSSSPSSTEHCT